MSRSFDQSGRTSTLESMLYYAVVAALIAVITHGKLFADEPVNYQKQIKPILTARCIACHGVLKQEGGLRLDTAAFAIKGGDSGPAIIPGNVDSSSLLQRISAQHESERMPPEGEPLKPEQIAAIRDWIVQNATAPADEQPERDPRDHWSFRPVVRAQVPPVNDVATGQIRSFRNPIDAFIAAEQAKQNIVPQPEANRRAWLRRVSLDLIGLPPTLAELDAFSNDQTAGAHERVVERLLDSPQYGERWARHWMDIWRYSDWWGLGAEVRNSQKHIWHWRDWIIESLNADKGYDQMLREMIAGDELYPNDLDRLRATGYLARQYFLFNRTLWMDELIEHTSKGMLGLTVNCAKCHDHKYDPLSHTDYYSLRAIFEPYQLRTEMVDGQLDYEKDGIPRAFDAHLDVPTYIHIRGDDMKPDKSKVIPPAIPVILNNPDLKLAIAPITLPAEAPYPGLRPYVVTSHRNAAQKQLTEAKHALEAAKQKLTESEAAAKEYAEKLTAATAERDLAAQEYEKSLIPANSTEPLSASAAITFQDNFLAPRPREWQPLAGTWKYDSGRLKQTGGGRGVMRLENFPYTDFQVRMTYLPEQSLNWKSIGFSYDLTADGNEIIVMATGLGNEWKSQIALKQSGSLLYPVSVKHPTLTDPQKPHEVVLRVRGGLLNFSFNGSDVLAFRLPPNQIRRPGFFDVITVDANVQFLSFELSPLGFDPKMIDSKPSEKKPVKQPTSPTFTPVDQAQRAVAVAEKACVTAEAQIASLEARITADQLIHAGSAAIESTNGGSSNNQTGLMKAIVMAAVKSEQAFAVAKADEELSRSELGVMQAKPEKKGEADARLAAAKKAFDEAVKGLNIAKDAHTPLPGAKKTQEDYQNRNADVPFPKSSTGRRTAFVNWMTNPRNPLTARVAVNHIWVRHMGKPLVSTVFDFGRKGTPPTHPELLDWLASELVEHNWSMKHMHRLITLSDTYRLSSSSANADPQTLAVDRENRTYWRMNPIRMSAQVVRDSLLSLAGELDTTIGGPSIDVKDDASRRRSMYYIHSHNEHQKFLATFDDANVLECYRRAESIVPQQALALENSELVTKMAEKIAGRLIAGAPNASDAEFVNLAYTTVMSIEPSSEEQAAILEILNRMTQLAREKNRKQPEQIARTSIVQTLINLNDFITIR